MAISYDQAAGRLLDLLGISHEQLEAGIAALYAEDPVSPPVGIRVVHKDFPGVAGVTLPSQGNGVRVLWDNLPEPEDGYAASELRLIRTWYL